MNGWDLLDGAAGTFAAFRGDGVLAFRDGAELADPRVSADFSAPVASLTLAGPRGGETDLNLCTATGTVEADGDATEFDALALRRSTPAEDGTDGIQREIAIVLDGGGLIAIAAHRPPDAAGHGDEETTAAVALAPGEPLGVGETLLSTEYDAAGLQRRATLELWPREDGDLPLRGAGVLLCAATRETPGDRRRAVAFFRWSVNGRPGLGRYEISGPA